MFLLLDYNYFSGMMGNEHRYRSRSFPHHFFAQVELDAVCFQMEKVLCIRGCSHPTGQHMFYVSSSCNLGKDSNGKDAAPLQNICAKVFAHDYVH